MTAPVRSYESGGLRAAVFESGENPELLVGPRSALRLRGPQRSVLGHRLYRTESPLLAEGVEEL